MFQPPVSMKARLFAQSSRLMLHNYLLYSVETARALIARLCQQTLTP